MIYAESQSLQKFIFFLLIIGRNQDLPDNIILMWTLQPKFLPDN